MILEILPLPAPGHDSEPHVSFRPTLRHAAERELLKGTDRDPQTRGLCFGLAVVRRIGGGDGAVAVDVANQVHRRLGRGYGGDENVL